MRNTVVMALAGAALLFAGVANAAGTAKDAKTANEPDANQIICKSGPPPTGTRLGGTRVCKTKLQWEQERQEAQQNLSHDQIQRGLGRAGN